MGALPGCTTVSKCLSLAMPSHQAFLQVCVMRCWPGAHSRQPSDEQNRLALAPLPESARVMVCGYTGKLCQDGQTHVLGALGYGVCRGKMECMLGSLSEAWLLDT